jgi:hypothetical protein
VTWGQLTRSKNIVYRELMVLKSKKQIIWNSFPVCNHPINNERGKSVLNFSGLYFEIFGIIQDLFDGEMNSGDAFLYFTHHPMFSSIIYTCVYPFHGPETSDASIQNILKIIRKHNKKNPQFQIERLICPGLGKNLK